MAKIEALNLTIHVMVVFFIIVGEGVTLKVAVVTIIIVPNVKFVAGMPTSL